MIASSSFPDPDSLVGLVSTSLEDDKAEDLMVVDLRGKTNIADYMVIASGRSQRQVGAMADHLLRKLRTVGVHASVEGQSAGDWVLVDAADVVVHLFRPEVRSFYNLEKMWGLTAPTPRPQGLDGAQGLDNAPAAH